MEGCPGCSSVQLWRISWGEGRLGPIGIDLNVWSRCSMEVPEALAVDREVFIVLIWHSIKSLDLGYRGNEVK